MAILVTVALGLSSLTYLSSGLCVAILLFLLSLFKNATGVKKVVFGLLKQMSIWDPGGVQCPISGGLGLWTSPYGPLRALCERASLHFQCGLIYSSICQTHQTHPFQVLLKVTFK